MTPYRVRAYKVLSSLEDVTEIRSSVSRLYALVRNDQPFASVNSSGSQVAAVYLMCLDRALNQLECKLKHGDTNGTYVNSDVLVDDHIGSITLRIGTGTGYSAMKLPLVSLTLRVMPRLMVWRPLALLTPFVEVDKADAGRTPWE